MNAWKAWMALVFFVFELKPQLANAAQRTLSFKLGHWLRIKSSRKTAIGGQLVLQSKGLASFFFL